jgi:hypothetical protein
MAMLISLIADILWKSKKKEKKSLQRPGISSKSPPHYARDYAKDYATAPRKKSFGEKSGRGKTVGGLIAWSVD